MTTTLRSRYELLDFGNHTLTTGLLTWFGVPALGAINMAIQVVEFSNGGYKTRKSTYSKEIFEF